MPATLIIHLSDLHIKTEERDLWTSERGRLIARSAVVDGPCEAIIIVVSGDTAYAGTQNQYKTAAAFLDALVDEARVRGNCTVKVVIAPGNHDCDFSLKSELRNYALTQRTDSTFENNELIDKLCEPLNAYREFEASTDTFDFSETTRIGKSGTMLISGVKLQIRVFNSPVFSQLKEKKGDLYLPLDAFEKGWDDNSFRIAVMHHPTAWFEQTISRKIRAALRSHATMTLYGHEHEPEISGVNSYNKVGSAGSIEIDGAVLHDHVDPHASSYITVVIDESIQTFSAYLHEWHKEAGYFKRSMMNGYGASSSAISIPFKKLHFSLSPAFEEQLSDPGIAAFTRLGRPIRMEDIYVVPHLLTREKNESVDRVLSANDLISIINWHGGVIVQGQERAGKSSLLLWLFKAYHSTDLIPLYIELRGSRLKNIEDFKKLVRASFNLQYPGESLDSFWALPIERRVFLLDDVDDLRTEELRTAIVEFLKTLSYYFIASTTLQIRIAEVLTDDSDGALGSIRQMSIDRFTSVKRSQMIRKWIELVEDKETAEDFLARVDQLEKGATAALGHNMVPRVPHMVLIFLQSSSATAANRLESGALAHYYTYLVTQHLLSANVPHDELDECLSFARAVSFKMHCCERTYISQSEINECNDEFSRLYYPGTISKRVNILRSAKLLVDYGSDAYQWRHSYFHFLFLGEYLGKNVQDPAIQTMVKEMASHLYVRSNANALLFLVHFSKESYVFQCLTEVITGLFKGQKPLKLGDDTQSFSRIIKNAREIYLPSVSPDESRSGRFARVDAHEREEGDGLQDSARADGLSLLDELIVLFKTSEIVGQVLKEQYASIKRDVRESVLIALLDAYLRACGGIIAKLQVNTELLKKWIESRVGETDSARSPADRAFGAEEFVSQLVQMFMFAFFQKLGDAIAGEKTLDLVRFAPWEKVVESTVFLLACELNLQRPIPFAQIDALLKTAGKDSAFVALIRNLVQMRVTMFHTRAPELQALSMRFKIPIEHLNGIAFRDPRTR